MCIRDRARDAQQLFERLEGIDISPAAGVAVASLLQAVATGSVGRKDSILLNITSGGVERFKQDHPVGFLTPSKTFPVKFLDQPALARELQVRQSVPA